MKWMYVLLAGALVLGGGVVGVLAFFDESPTERISVSEAVEPVMLIEATGLIGGGPRPCICATRPGTNSTFDSLGARPNGTTMSTIGSTCVSEARVS